MTNYYVKNGGNNSYTGLSDAQAWDTIAKVNDFAEATGFSDGDCICFKRGSTFDDETLGYDGSDIVWGTINGLTFQDYGTGDKPIFDGDTINPIKICSSTISNLTLKNLYLYGAANTSLPIHLCYIDGIVVDGVDGNGRGGGLPGVPQGVIKMSDVEGSVEFKNCNQSDWGPTINPSLNALDTCVFYIWIDPVLPGPTSISIHDNTVYNINSDAIHIGNFQGTVSNQCDIYNNTFYNCGENAIDIKASKYVNIYDNTLYCDNWAGGGTSGSGPLIVVHLSSSFPGVDCDYVRIYNNLFNGNNDGTYTNGGVAFNTGNILNMFIYNNMFMNVSPAILIYRGTHEIYNNVFISNEILNIDSSLKTFIRQGKKAKVYNNTFYASSDSTIFQAIYHEDGNESIYKNNIIEINSNSTASYAHPFYANIDVNAAPAVSNNIYHNSEGTRRIFWDGTLYDSGDEAAWIAAGHTGAQFADPLLTAPDTDDLTLQSSSPAIDAGANLGVDYDDALNPASTWPDGVTTLDQDDYGAAWDIGAFVYIGAVPYTRFRGINRQKPRFNQTGGRFR